MKKTIFVPLFSAAALLAQTPQIIEDKQLHVITAGPAMPAMPAMPVEAMGAFSFVSAEMGFESALVKGVPFTGDFVTENVQVLADGNRIRNTNTTSFARDGEGRTRREITIDAIGPFTGGGSHKTIFIHDPVSKIDYVLDPQTKTARKINVAGAAAKTNTTTLTRDGGNVVFTRRMEGPKGAVTETVQGPTDTAAGIAMPTEIGMQSGVRTVVGHRTQLSTASAMATVSDNVKSDSLGKRIIEGVEADGTRTTITIPAGQIGNDRALETVSERWYSNELKTIVLTTRKDPRMGENNYKLSNLRRGEPSRQLFEVPSDYKIVTEDNVGPNIIRMRINKQDEE